MPRRLILVSLAFLAISTASREAAGAPWIAPDWGGREPSFPPGSLYFQTNAYRTAPVLFRTVLDLPDRPVEFAGLEARAMGYLYVFLNGRKFASREEKADAEVALTAELTHLLRPGRNVLVLSTRPEGLSLEGAIGLGDGSVRKFGTGAGEFKVQKLRPLAILEDEACMRPDFDGSGWFPAVETGREGNSPSVENLKEACEGLRKSRLERWDEDGRWRLEMLSEKGIAIIDWEARGWAGPGRLPGWLIDLARENEPPGSPPGSVHLLAEALTRYVLFSDEALNLENQARGLEALGVAAAETEPLADRARSLRAAASKAEEAIRARRWEEALRALPEAHGPEPSRFRGRPLGRLNHPIENKFRWFDTTALLESDVKRWGLRLGSPVSTFSSPLSPATLVTVKEKELLIQGWDSLKPIKVYTKPPAVGPVSLWAAMGGKAVSLRPGAEGVVYDAALQGKLGENWVLLVSDLARGGHLPVELVFLDRPARIAFRGGGESASEVAISFEKSGARLFLLRPLKEWRGMLEEARILTQAPLDERRAGPYLEQCRLWSRALLAYPVTFSEVSVPDPADPMARLVADVYNYRDFEDAWGTRPLRLAPLPVLACYGLLMGYPGLKAESPAEVLGSWGIWGDHLAVRDREIFLYRAPLDPVKRFGGFTSYCFGPTDIGEPGGITEIESVKATGSNSFRPQHNDAGERALKTVRWCAERGIQNVFNIDEKWVPDAVEHYRKLARECRDFPPDAVAYDLLNEPETREPRAYNAFVKKIAAAIREIDRTHIIYIEAMPPWGPGAKPFPQGAFESLEPTGDPLTVYSFHDYEYRLPRRWPGEKGDVRDLLERWIPAFRFAIDHRAPIHLGEFGGFEQTKESVFENRCALTMMMDYLEIFEGFGWHWHYYANRGVTRVRKDGSLEESFVQEACRRHFARGTFNAVRPR